MSAAAADQTPIPDGSQTASVDPASPDATTEALSGAQASPTPVPSPSETVPSEPLKGAEQIKDAVAEQSMTVAQLIEQMDAIGIDFGDTRFSLWTVLLVVLVVVGVLALARVGSHFARSAVKRFSKLSPTQSLLAEKLSTLAVWALAILIGIDILGIDLTALAVFSGAFGLAIGFGLQKTFGNLIAGIILLMDRSIKPGDVIAVSDTAGNETFGQIRKIGIRAVSIVTRDEKEYLIPNENLMINQVENWSYSSRNVRMQVPVGVSYACDIALAEKLMLQAAKSCRRVLDTPSPTVWLDGYGNSSVDFIIHCWIRDPEAGVGNIKSEVLKTLWDLFQENDIEIPFPQRDINLRGNEQFDQLVAAISQRVGNDKPKQ